ncbi:GNAT family N-acetyltransferase [uncultured Desulfobacter sp.]|uniref:GNAT family N-acetyltransferase n=1 Tax=uncultured Desulfobacter sp. TaxID=240139 RepID=UPI002AAB0AFA|nr:GNAT family N-acetyltransferase [uncultured Desulfobacter sp.]
MNQINFSSSNISMRPANPNDSIFIEELFRSTRNALRLGDNDPEYVEEIIGHQFNYQTLGYGAKYPNALTFIIEHHRERIGRTVVDFGHNSVHLLDIAFIPIARGKGFGKTVLQSLQEAAKKICVPMTLVVDQSNATARHLYLGLGFVVESVQPPSELMIWYPPANTVII